MAIEDVGMSNSPNNLSAIKKPVDSGSITRERHKSSLEIVTRVREHSVGTIHISRDTIHSVHGFRRRLRRYSD